MGRRQHVEATLLKNIQDNLPKTKDDPEVEFILLDYNSKDGLQDWIKNNAALKPFLDNSTLVYAKYPDATHFHHAHAKNMAHRLATGDVVCNLDADNYTGKDFARYLATEFANGEHVLSHFTFGVMTHDPDKNGFFGRISMRREDFLALGGYSETRFKKGWGYEDTDFIMRAMKLGLESKPMFNKEYMGVIAHGNEERVKNTLQGVNSKDIDDVSAGRAKNRHRNFILSSYFTRAQANHGNRFGEGKLMGLDNQPLPALKKLESFVSIAKRNPFAVKSFQATMCKRAP